MYRSLTAPVVALALLLGGSAGARAGLVPPSEVRWQYNFTPTVSSVAGSAGGSLTFTNEPDIWSSGNDGYVNVTFMKLNSNATIGSAESFPNGEFGFSLTLKVPDYVGMGAPISSTPLTFGGKLTGTFYNENSSVGKDWTDAGPKFVDVGGYRFTVEFVDFSRPGPPSQQTLRGSITAHVTVDYTPTGNPDPDPQETPEPASLVLCGLGAALGGLAWWRRRKPPEA